MSLTADDITSALKKLGEPVAPGKLAAELGVEQLPGALIKRMIDDGSIKAAGAARGRRLALPGQKIEGATDAPPQTRKTRKKRKGKKTGKAAKARQAPPAGPAERFIPTVDVERRLVVVNGAEPLIFTGEQTLAIATLLFNHYED